MASTNSVIAPDIKPTVYTSSCLQKTTASKWTDVALITAFAVLLTIGILASTGALNSIGTTNVMYLFYGMYAGAALFLTAEIVKVVVLQCAAKKALIRKKILIQGIVQTCKEVMSDTAKNVKTDAESGNTDAQMLYDESVAIFSYVEKHVKAVLNNKQLLTYSAHYLQEWSEYMQESESMLPEESEKLKKWHENFNQWRAKSEHPTPKIKLTILQELYLEYYTLTFLLKNVTRESLEDLSQLR